MRARIGQFASSIGNRISAIAGRALAHGRLVFGNANGILAARQFIANVVAGVRETIAQLSGRTVDVVDARDALATGCHVVWIASVWPGRTLTFSDVIVADANRLWATIDIFACRATGSRSRSIDSFAFLRLRAFGRRCALTATFHLTSISILWIANETGQTLAFAVEKKEKSNFDRKGVGIE